MFDQRGELPFLPFGNPIGFVPASRGGVYTESIMITEADTCRKYVLPKLIQAGWDDDPHSFTERKTFTDGRIVVAGNKTRRRSQKRADQVRKEKKDFFIKYSPDARAILNELLDKYAELVPPSS